MQLIHTDRVSYIQGQSHKSLPFHLCSLSSVKREPFSLTSRLSEARAQTPINASFTVTLW